MNITSMNCKKALIPILALNFLAISETIRAQTWVPGGSTSLWSDSANWTPGVPANDDTATATINGTGTAFVSVFNSAWVTGAPGPGVIHGLILNQGTADYQVQTTGAITVGLGAGGITMASSSGRNTYLNFSGAKLNLTASQTWNVGAGSILQPYNSMQIISAAGVVLTKTGTGTLEFSNTVSSLIQGGIILDQGTLLYNAATIGVLGSTALTWRNNGATNLTFAVYSNALASQTFAQAITFQSVGTNSTDTYNFTTGLVAAGATVDVTGNWTGTAGKQIIFNAAGNGLSNNFDNGILRISGANSGLTTSAAVYLRNGNIVLNSASAFGTGNAFAVSLGQQAGGAIGSASTLASLRATSGNTIGGNISINTSNSTAVQFVEMGLSGTGSLNLTGNISLGTVNVTTSTAPMVYLTAPTGGVAHFTGNIADNSSTNTYISPVFVKGGGTVDLAGTDTYRGKTTVGGNSTLLISGSLGNAASTLAVGYVANPALTATTNATTTLVTVTSTAGFVVGQTVTGTNIAAGTVVTSIDSSTSLHISKIATGSGAITDFAGLSENGTLGGAGTISNATVVNSGSVINPGAGLAGVATLKFDGSLTASPVVSMLNGSSFTFNLTSTVGSADEVKFYNFTTGDLSLSGTVAVNFATTTGVQAGSYKLFEFYSNNGTTLTASGLSSGLTLGSSTVNGLNAALQYNANDISLVLSAVPEPGTWALLILGSLVVVVAKRRRTLGRNLSL